MIETTNGNTSLKDDSLFHPDFVPLVDPTLIFARTVPCGLHGRCELQVLTIQGCPKGARFHYQEVPVKLAEAMFKSSKPSAVLKISIKPYHHFYRADLETGKPFQAPK